MYGNIAHGGGYGLGGGLGNGYGGYNPVRGQFGRYAGGLADIGNEDFTRRRYLGGGGGNIGFDYYGDYPEYSDYTGNNIGGGGNINLRQQFAGGQLGMGHGGQQYSGSIGQQFGGGQLGLGQGQQSLNQGRFMTNGGGGYRNIIAGGFNAGNRGFGQGYGGAGGYNAQNLGIGQNQFG